MNYVVTGYQITAFTFSVAAFVAVVTIAANFAIDFLHLPEVHVNAKNECVKVVNYKNGDGYTCQDKDVVLRRYRVVRSSHA